MRMSELLRSRCDSRRAVYLDILPPGAASRLDVAGS